LNRKVVEEVVKGPWEEEEDGDEEEEEEIDEATFAFGRRGTEVPKGRRVGERV
jgi:hypothetical protein